MLIRAWSRPTPKHFTTAISLIAFSTVLFYSCLSSSSNIYAQAQSGPATSGSATGGVGNSGGTTCSQGATCNFFGGGATSGSANSGSATSGQSSGQGANSDSANSGPSSTPSQNISITNPPTVNLIGSWSYSGTNPSNNRFVSAQIAFYPSGKYQIYVHDRDMEHGTFNFDSGSKTITLKLERMMVGHEWEPVLANRDVWPMTNIQENSFDVITNEANFHFVRSQ